MARACIALRRHYKRTMHRLICLNVFTAVAVGLLACLPVQARDREALQRFVNDRAAEYRQRSEAAIARARDMGLPVRREFPDGRVIQVKRLLGSRPIYLTTDNEDAADTVSTDEVWPGGSLGLSLDGSGQKLGIWDGGRVRGTHQELTGRVTNLESPSVDLSSHATHVSGTMIASGVAAGAQGMSPAATLRSWDFNNDDLEIASEQLSADPIRVSNHSYSFITGWTDSFAGSYAGCGFVTWVWYEDVAASTSEDRLFGYYDDSSRDWDQIAADAPDYVMVKSAGNDRNDSGASPGSMHIHYDSGGPAGPGWYCTAADSHPADGGASGYDTIAGGSASAKNIITVGAVSDITGGYTGPGDVSLAGFSGAGPTDDGRIKPDVVANGISLYSSTAGSNGSYANYSGTSMSSPNVSGSIGLLSEHAENLFGVGFSFRSSTIKGLVIHTADESGSSAGPDYMHGWGLLNTGSAVQLMSAEAAPGSAGHIYELTLDDGETETLELYSDGTGPLKVTIAWIDPPGTPPAFTVDPADLMLVNDLDLRLVHQSSSAHQPWVLDPASPSNAATTGDNFRDNLEQVMVASPASGLYTVSVSHKSSLEDGASQPFSLIVSGNVAIPPDLDGDQMPNSFEQANGLDQLDAGDAILDTDNDGLDNLEEFLANTDPGDSDSDDDGVRDGLDPFPALSEGSDDNFCDQESDSTRALVTGQMISSSQILICADPDGVDVGVDSNSKVEVMNTGELRIITPGTTELRPGGFRVAPGAKVLLVTEPLP